jgi:hypothetical protein
MAKKVINVGDVQKMAAAAKVLTTLFPRPISGLDTMPGGSAMMNIKKIGSISIFQAMLLYVWTNWI